MAVNVTHTDQFMRDLGVEVYRVGGSVRDEILGRPVKDCDYMVRGQTLAQLHRTLMAALGAGGYEKYAIKPLEDRERRPLGLRVSARGLGAIEITLPRVEVSTGPGHRDFDIKLDPMLSLTEDAKRRDFTFNALYRCLSDGTRDMDVVSDPTSRGLYDLEHKLVQTTYRDSFRDDPLRILRAARFVSVLGYDVTLNTREQMVHHAAAVNGLKTPAREQTHTVKLDGGVISKKRIPGDEAKPAAMSGTVKDEMEKILMGRDAAKALRLLAQTGSLGILFPELAPMIGFDQRSKYHDLTTDEHTFSALETAAKCDAPLRVRWALLFHDSGKPLAGWFGDDGRRHYYRAPWFKQWHADAPDYANPEYGEDHEDVSERLWRAAAERMNIDRRTREDVATLIREHMVPCTGKIKPVRVRRRRVHLGDDLLRDLHMHRMCDLTGKGKSNRQHLIHIAAQEQIRIAAQLAGIPASTKQLALTKDDKREAAERLGGAQLGAALATILDEVVVQPTEQKLSREWQLKRLRGSDA